MALFGYCTYGAFICVAIFFRSKGLDINNWLILFMFMGFDIITGISKAYVLWSNSTKEYYENGKVKNTWFQTHKLKIGILSKFLVAMLPFLVLFLAQVTGRYSVAIPTDILIALLCAAEFISSIQNIIVVKTGKAIEEIDAVTFALNALLSTMKKSLDIKLSK